MIVRLIQCTDLTIDTKGDIKMAPLGHNVPPAVIMLKNLFPLDNVFRVGLPIRS